MRTFVSFLQLPWNSLQTKSHEGRLRLRAGASALSEKGSAMVEFALVLPVLLLLMTGIGSFGIALNNYLTLTDAVSIGAQKLAISRNSSTDPCSDAAAFVQNAAPFLNPNKISLKFVLNGATYGPYSGTTASSCSSGSTSLGAAGNLVQGQSAQVIATYPCTLAVYGYNFNCNLHAQITEIVQ